MKYLKILFILAITLSSFSFADTLQRIENFDKLYDVDFKSNVSKAQILNAIKFVELCHLSDQDDKTILKKYPKALIFETHKTEIKFFIIKNHKLKTQTLAIRGSTTVQNWIQDAKFFKVTDEWAKGIKVHKGFYQSAREVFAKAKKHLRKSYQTKITGHSLGGGVAILMGSYLKHHKYLVNEIITFGQPRITNKDGATVLRNLPLERVTVELDLVPSLPPKFLGYRHFGKSLVVKHNEVFQSNRIIESNKKDSDQALQAWDDLERNHQVMKTNFQSHRLRNYLKNLYNALED
ncbi:MAG: lipase family protein [Candidatus Cloacimonetes bacterium]|nr:lipase family protein [Candidatus Cloacimonadota bacterium]